MVQCREKIKKLKGDYRKAKDRNNRSGRRRNICTFFNQLNAILGCRGLQASILGCRPASSPDTVVGSMRSMGGEASIHCGDESRDESSESTATDERKENVDHLLSTQGKCNIFPCVLYIYLYRYFKFILRRCVKMALPECAETGYSHTNTTTSENSWSCTPSTENQSATNRYVYIYASIMNTSWPSNCDIHEAIFTIYNTLKNDGVPSFAVEDIHVKMMWGYNSNVTAIYCTTTL